MKIHVVKMQLVYEKCCVLTTWKFIDFHVNQSLAINGNEQFVWVRGSVDSIKSLSNHTTMFLKCRLNLRFRLHPMHKQVLFYPLALKEAQPLGMFTWQDKPSFWQIISLTSGFYFYLQCFSCPQGQNVMSYQIKPDFSIVLLNAVLVLCQSHFLSRLQFRCQ